MAVGFLGVDLAEDFAFFLDFRSLALCIAFAIFRILSFLDFFEFLRFLFLAVFLLELESESEVEEELDVDVSEDDDVVLLEVEELDPSSSDDWLESDSKQL